MNLLLHTWVSYFLFLYRVTSSVSFLPFLCCFHSLSSLRSKLQPFSAPAAVDLEMCGDIHPKFIDLLVDSSLQVVKKTLQNLHSGVNVYKIQRRITGVS